MLYRARLDYEVEAVSFDYGQRHISELGAASAIAKMADVPHHIIALPWLGALGGSALTTDAPIAPTGGPADYHAPDGLPTSFVPGRNLVLLAAAVPVAYARRCRSIFIGVSEADYSGYPDCRSEFISEFETAMQSALPSSVRLSIATPFMYCSKKTIVEKALKLPGCMNALALSVTCYEGRRPGCGVCPACVLRARAFEEAGVTDPATDSATDSATVTTVNT